MGFNTVLGKTNRKKDFIWRGDDRTTHMHIIGATKQGKSRLLEGLIRQDITNRSKPGVLLIDPHGELYDELVSWCARRRIHKRRTIHLINPSEEEWTVGFNPLRLDVAIEISVRVEGMVEACAQVWRDEDMSGKPLLKKMLRAVFYALAAKGYTLVEAINLITSNDKHDVRRFLTTNLDDFVQQGVWDEVNVMGSSGTVQMKRLFMEQFGSTMNRLVEFLSSPTIRHMIGQRESVINFKECMDNGDIILVNLGMSDVLSTGSADVLGTLLLNDVFQTALTRNVDVAKKRPFYVYIDEADRFLSGDVESMLDQTRKFGVHLTISHQRLGQLRDAGEGIYNAVMTNAKTKVVFGGLSYEDSNTMAAEIFRSELDLEKGVERTKNPMVVGTQIEWLESELETNTKSTADINVDSVGASSTELFDFDGEPLTLSEGIVEGHASGRTEAESHSRTEGRQQSRAPIYEDRYSSVHSLQNVIHEKGALLGDQRPRKVVVKAPAKPSQHITTRFIKRARVLPKQRAEFIQAVLTNSAYAKPQIEVKHELELRQENLRTQAKMAFKTDQPHYSG